MGNKKHLIICYLLISVLLLSIFSTNVSSSESNENNKFYGYIINVSPDQSYSLQTNITRLINQLLHENISVYWITSNTEVSTSQLDLETESLKRSFNKGSYLITFGSTSSKNLRAISLVHNYFLNYDVESYRILDPLKSLDVIELVEPKIAHYDGKATYTSYYYTLEAGGFLNQKKLTPEQVLDELTNENYNILIWGGGDPTAIVEIRQDLVSIRGVQVRKKIRTFIENGGGYTGSCYGGWRAASGFDRPLGLPLYLGTSQLLNLLPMQLNLLDVNVYRALPGSGDVDLKITNTDNPLTFGLPEIIHNHSYAGGPMFIDKRIFKSNTEVIGIIDSVGLDDWDWDAYMELCPWWSSPFVSNDTKMKIAKYWMEQNMGAAIWVTGKFGEGKVVAYGGHPEHASTSDWGMDDNELPRTVYNTIFYLCSKDSSQISLEKSYSFSKLDVDAGGPYIGLIDDNIQFYGTVENGESPFEWAWEFEIPYTWYNQEYSNENLIYEQNPEYAYHSLGDYKATLIVIDANGNVGSDVAEIEILYSYTEPKPKIDIEPYEGIVGEEIQFNCSIKYGGFPPFDYHWDFGDGEESDEKNPIHAFNKKGEFYVVLEVTDDWGSKTTVGEFVYIAEEPRTTQKSSSDPFIIILVSIISLIIIIIIILIILKKKRF